MNERYSRRRFLTSTAVVGSVAIAGCSSESGDGGGNDTTTQQSDGDGDDGSGDDQGGDSKSWTKKSTVDMTDGLKFEPKRIEVSKGTTVTWKNVGAVAHSVTGYEEEMPDGADYFASGGFDSEQAANDNYPDEGSIAKDESYEYTFETTGTYEYYCIPHEMSGMVGYVKVV